MKNYLVTGALGFAGSKLVKKLLCLDFNIIGVDIKEEYSAKYKNYKYYKGDLRDLNFVDFLFKKCGPFDGIFHFAVQKSDDNFLEQDLRNINEMFGNNVISTYNLLAKASARRKIKFIYASSISVYGEVKYLPVDEEHPLIPKDFYGFTKYLGEECVKYGSKMGYVQGIILRYPGMFGIGSNYGAIYLYTSKCLRNETVEVYGGGKPRKDYIFVEDVAESALLAMRSEIKEDFDIFNISGLDPDNLPPPTLKEIAEMVIKNFDKGKLIINDNKPAEPVNIYFDGSKAKKILGYKPTPIELSIKKYVKEMKELKRGKNE